MRSWGGTGIIARIETAEVARAILASACRRSRWTSRPSSSGPTAAFPAERGRLGFVGCRQAGGGAPARAAFTTTRSSASAVGSESRRRGRVLPRIREAGFETHVYHPPRSDRVWEREQPDLHRWLRLPRPVGLMACNDDRGREVLEACRVGGLHVPEEMAVVGVDNDELLCELADPPLSSVALNAEAGGYRVAALLDQMMRARLRGRATDKASTAADSTDPRLTRRSTDIIAQGHRDRRPPLSSWKIMPAADRRRGRGQEADDFAASA